MPSDIQAKIDAISENMQTVYDTKVVALRPLVFHKVWGDNDLMEYVTGLESVLSMVGEIISLCMIDTQSKGFHIDPNEHTELNN